MIIFTTVIVRTTIKFTNVIVRTTIKFTNVIIFTIVIVQNYDYIHKRDYSEPRFHVKPRIIEDGKVLFGR